MRRIFFAADRARDCAHNGPRLLFVGTAVGLAALAALAACATSDGDAPLEPSVDPAPSPEVDSGSIEPAPLDASAPPVESPCSSDGWCLTHLPDTNLVLKDVWPFEDRAFAIAESQALGVKVLEWTDAEGWRYIDDNTQNGYEDNAGLYAGAIWAPSENEVFFGSSPAYIYHGTRSDPASPWSWSRSRLPDNSRDSPSRDHGLAPYKRRYFAPHVQSEIVAYPALGVWGTSADDVYAWYANTIFHWGVGDGGAPGWIAEHIEDDVEAPGDTFYIFGASGSSRDDVWFAGGRARYDEMGNFSYPTACPTVVRKTPEEGYRRLVDHVFKASYANDNITDVCGAKSGALSFAQKVFFGSFQMDIVYSQGSWFTNIASTGPGTAVGIVGGSQFVYLTDEDGGRASANSVSVNLTRDIVKVPTLVNSVWVQDTDVWIGGSGMVLKAEKDPVRWGTGMGLNLPSYNAGYGLDAATYHISSTALHGAALETSFFQVRGTSNSNLWAIGTGYALHKTTSSTP